MNPHEPKQAYAHTLDPLAPDPAVCLQHVSVNRGRREVLQDIDLCVEEGVFLGLIGPNGGGKTTLLQVILGLLTPAEGWVEVFGQPPKLRHRRHQTIGYVPQNQVIPQHFPATVYDVVLMGAYGVSYRLWPIRHEYKVRARHLLTQVKMDHLAEMPIGQLSGGQQQRVFIARALITHPRLLLLDEPLRGLDAAGQIQFFDLLIGLKQQYDLTVIMVSHNITHISKFTDRIACLNRTIHWHDRSEMISHEVLHHVYKCELEAMFTYEESLDGVEDNPFRSPADPSIHHH